MTRPPIVTVRELSGLRVQLFVTWPDREHQDQSIELNAPAAIQLISALSAWLWRWAQRSMNLPP